MRILQIYRADGAGLHLKAQLIRGQAAISLPSHRAHECRCLFGRRWECHHVGRALEHWRTYGKGPIVRAAPELGGLLEHEARRRTQPGDNQIGAGKAGG